MGPRSGSGGFSSRGGRGVRVWDPRGPGRASPLSPRACTFPGDSVTTGFRAAEPGGKVAPAFVRENLQPLGVWPVRGPWKTLPAAGRGPFRSHGRSTGEDCSQCSPTAASVSVADHPARCLLGSVAKLAPHPTRLETRTKESNMCASHWACTNPKGEVKAKAYPLGGLRCDPA